MSARITIDDNLTADPDLGVSNSGTSWARLRVVSHDRVRRNGEWTSTDPEFFNVCSDSRIIPRPFRRVTFGLGSRCVRLAVRLLYGVARMFEVKGLRVAEADRSRCDPSAHARARVVRSERAG